jgi:DNA-binding MarR family transcriptional regulator
MTKTVNNSFSYLLTDVPRLFRTHFDRRATRFGLTRAQWRALKRLHTSEGMSQSELAELLEMEPIAVGRVIDRLQQAGFVERRADPKDRRCWRLYVAEKAHSVVDDMEKIAAELRRESLRGVRKADVDTMLMVLAKMKENLQALAVPEAGGEKER